MALTSFHLHLSIETDVLSLYVFLEQNSYMIQLWLPKNSKFGKLSSGPKSGKGQFSFQSQRKAMPKNAQTTAQLPSSLKLVMLKILQASLKQ